MSGSSANPTGLVAYNPYDPTQAALLSALSQGETGGSTNPLLGYGGANLAGSATDAYGFPQWSGVGNTHAAGLYQFQPSTWDSIASEYNLNFNSVNDQNAGAWYLAQQTYAQKTNGGSLSAALQAGDYGSIQSALSGTWTSVTGNGSLPGGLASYLSNEIGSGTIPSVPGGTSGATSSASGSSTGSLGGSGSGIVGEIENWFVRFGLIVVGAIIIIVALWYLLKDQGLLPKVPKLA